MSNTGTSVVQVTQERIEDRGKQLLDMVSSGKLPNRWEEFLVHEFLTESCYYIFDIINRLPSDIDNLFREGFSAPIFQHVRYDQENVIEATVRIYNRIGTTDIYMDGCEGQKGSDPYPDGAQKQIWTGMTEWTRELQERGVDDNFIHYTEPAYNTPEETREMLNLAQNHGWEHVILVGNSYQMLRIALGTVQMMKDRNFWVKCYFAFPPSGDLTIDMKGAQGASEGSRDQQFWAEFMRIPEYQMKGNLCSFPELVNYLAYGRESIVDNKLTEVI